MIKKKAALRLPEAIPATDQDKEKSLLAGLEEPREDGDLADHLYQLAVFYNRNGRSDLAAMVIDLAVNHCDDPEKPAFFYMRLGQISEQEKQFPRAIRYYAKGLELKPSEKFVAYFLHNNLGYCLDAEERYKEGEELCRAAIQIDAARANAFKNLGISLRGQGDVVGAAWAYAEAAQIDPSDSRPFTLLQELIAKHPRLLMEQVFAFFRSPLQIS